MFSSSITSWFGGKSQQSSPRRRPTVRLGVEGLETREMPAVFGPDLTVIARNAVHQAQVQLQAAVAVQRTTIGQQMANYLQGQVNAGRRIGGGECPHLATEALRASGADFTRTEPTERKITSGQRTRLLDSPLAAN